MAHNLDTLISALHDRLIETAGITGQACATSVTSITADSRRVARGDMFVAVRGTAVDGHRFIADACRAGAAAVVCEEFPEYMPEGTAFMRVRNSAEALGLLASAWWGNPSEKLTLIGVTGTNGKTTIATLLYDMARAMGLKAGLLSTVVNRIDDESVAATHTTPDPLELNALLARMVDAGCTFAAMEVSSHAADQRRIAGLKFAGGVFTNLTRDHLDYHKTFDAYLRAKQSFFDSLGAKAFALTNADDRNGDIMLQNTAARRYAYSLRRDADFRGRVIEDRLDGMLMSFDGTEVETMFTGRFNASNLTAVYATGLLLGYSREAVLRAISMLRPVSGRFETVRVPGSGITGIVDYAHTPDALANVLDTINEVLGAGSPARVICVCGAGGDRDTGKRPIMASEAVRRCSQLILTSDNPRSENPDDIIAAMLDGIPADRRDTVLTIADRRSAIRTAAAIAAEGDVILVAGKGHETYQIIAGRTIHFDDREELRLALTDKTLKN